MPGDEGVVAEDSAIPLSPTLWVTVPALALFVGIWLSEAKPNHRVPNWKFPFSNHPGPTSIAMCPHKWQSIDCGNPVPGLTHQTHIPGTSPGG